MVCAGTGKRRLAPYSAKKVDDSTGQDPQQSSRVREADNSGSSGHVNIRIITIALNISEKNIRFVLEK